MSVGTHVVIVNFRSADLLRRCLDSLAGTEVRSVTIVDNDSGTAERPRLDALERSHARVRVVHVPENLGFGAGVNLGVVESGASSDDFVWILNPDTVVDAAAPRLLASALSQDLADIVSPVIATGNDSTRSLWFAGGRIDYRRGVAWHEERIPAVGRPDVAVYGTGYITGAAPMMSRSTWDALGGFREDLFLYWEDVELCARALDQGMRLGVARGARIWHAQGGSTGHVSGGMSELYYYYGQRNRIVVCGSRVSRSALTFGPGLRETARLLLRPLIVESAPRGRKAWASARGLVDGWRGTTGRGPY